MASDLPRSGVPISRPILAPKRERREAVFRCNFASVLRGLRSLGLRGVLACALCAWCAGPRLVRAQAAAEPAQPAPREPEPAPLRHALDGELSYFAKDEANASLDLALFQLGARYVLSDRYWLSGAFGIATLVSTPKSGDGDVVWRPSNPEVLGHYRVPLEPSLPFRLSLAVGVAGPLATITRGPDARLHRTTLSYAQAMDGLSRMWRWLPNRTTVITSAELEYDAHEELTLLLDVQPALLIPSREDFYTEKLDLIVPSSVAAMTTGTILRGGLRLRAVLLPTFALDQAQFSIEPFARLALGCVFAEARYTLPLDEPLAGARGPQAWGLHLRAGAEL